MGNLVYISAAIGIIALGLSCYVLYRLWSLNRLRKIFFSGQSGGDLENVLSALSSQLKDLQRDHSQLEQVAAALGEQGQMAVQKVGLVRFNPFADGGGNFSFSLALLDNHNSGVVITSMHGREQNRIYSKFIDAGASEIQLTEEELQAIALAHSRLQQGPNKTSKNKSKSK